MVECKWAQSLSCAWLWATLWTVACQAPLSMGFSRQESWSRFPCSPSRGPSQTRDQTHVSCISCTASPAVDDLRILYCWPAREDPWLSNTTKSYATTKNISMNVYLCIGVLQRCKLVSLESQWCNSSPGLNTKNQGNWWNMKPMLQLKQLIRESEFCDWMMPTHTGEAICFNLPTQMLISSGNAPPDTLKNNT